MWKLANGSLYVENMQKILDGIYRCVATNKEGSSIKTYKLITKSPLGEQTTLIQDSPQKNASKNRLAIIDFCSPIISKRL